MEANGDHGLALKDGDRLWMEIDLELVTAEEDAVDDESHTVNRVRLHIPYPNLWSTPERDYFPPAHAIGPISWVESA